MSHILLTGGAGFIGSHVAERLLQANERVTILDSFDDFYSPAVKRRNLEAASKYPGYRLVEGDIRDRTALARVSEDRIDVIVHLAARAGVRPSLQQPAVYADVNINGTVALLELAKQAGIQRFVFGSSSSVYGNDARPPFRETERADRPISPYAASKRAGELFAHTYHELYGLTVASLRFFTVYGPRQRPDLAIHKFACRMLRGETIEVYGDGSMRRDFTYVDDIVGGIIGAIEWSAENRGAEVFNLGESVTTSVTELIMLLEEALDCRADVRHQPEQLGDVQQTFADVGKAKRMLGYDPKVSMREGLARFAEWLQVERMITR